MNVDFWKNIAALWCRRDNIEDYNRAFEAGRAFGSVLKKQTTVYRDDDFFFYDDDDEDGI